MKNKYLYNAALLLVCALILSILGWSDGPGLKQLNGGAESSFYNLLIQGFDAGQLNIITQSPNEEALQNSWAEFADMSYYKGKLYVYFGVAPAIVLYWPYFLATGDYLSDQAAVFIFLTTGFLALAFLLCSIWKRYFPKVDLWIFILCLFTMGFAISTIEADWWWSDVYQVAQSSGFAFAMLCLVAIWQAMHKVKRKIIWLLIASLTYGLAIASRPNFLFGAIVIFIPLIYEWRKVGQSETIKKICAFSLATICPMAAIGVGLMIYNYLRFGNALEFGWRYQVGHYLFRQHTVELFNFRFFWFNFSYYFLEPMHWVSHFPFLKTFDPPIAPLGHEGALKGCGGILLVNFPLALVALAVALAWKRKVNNESTPLRLLIIAVSVLFVSSNLSTCLFCTALYRYELDFLPELMILSVVGIFFLEQEISGLWRRLTRFAWCLLLADTLAFNTLANVEGNATGDNLNGNFLLHRGRAREAIKYLENAEALEPGSAEFQKALGTAYQTAGMVDQAIVQYEKALAIDPSDAGSQYFLGYAYFQSGKPAEAIEHFNLAFKIDSHCLESYGNYSEHTAVAWSFATDADPAKRDAPLAIEFAERACRETDYQTPIVIGTLAAAYAEAGRYDDAIATARKAVALAEKQGDPTLQRNRDFLALYVKHQQFHQAAPLAISP